MKSASLRVSGADIFARKADGWKDGTAATDFTLPCGSGPWGLCGESGESGAWSTAGLTGSSKISGVLALAPVFTTRNIVSNNNNDVIMCTNNLH